MIRLELGEEVVSHRMTRREMWKLARATQLTIKICLGYQFDGSDITKNLGESFGQEISIYVTIAECS